MGTRVNQYFMYGILVPYNWYRKWEQGTGRSFHAVFADFMNDDVDTDDISCLFDGRDGRFIIIGKVLERSADDEYLGSDQPIRVPEFDEIDKIGIRESVKKNFDLEGQFHFYFVTQYR